MATPLNQGPPIQDLAPKGGYPSIKFARHLPNRGPPGWAMFGGCGLIMFAGLMAFGNTNDKRRQAKFEKRLARIALVPLLQAEIDEAYVSRTHLAEKNRILRKKNEFVSGLNGNIVEGIKGIEGIEGLSDENLETIRRIQAENKNLVIVEDLRKTSFE